MDRLHYAGSSILTGTAIAHALLDYAQALAGAGDSATVEVPTLNEDGSRGRSEVLIGPASQLISDSEPSPYDEIVDEDLVAHLRDVSARVRNDRSPSPAAGMIQDEFDDGYTDEF
ncbi:hypothetical protein [Microbacterium sp. zg-YB36]|uniref:hypothetical protein n=1 Tax=Microbacterium sp. zg-YB36 TaxID=2969407 RepID=UPI00214D0B18|nr:hypothetical protein [Microbacterium sp. zg-YB36]MDL5351676.1 hypothetical protein [Microbacterium sp. zg-YB36]